MVCLQDIWRARKIFETLHALSTGNLLFTNLEIRCPSARDHSNCACYCIDLLLKNRCSSPRVTSHKSSQASLGEPGCCTKPETWKRCSSSLQSLSKAFKPSQELETWRDLCASGCAGTTLLREELRATGSADRPRSFTCEQVALVWEAPLRRRWIAHPQCRWYGCCEALALEEAQALRKKSQLPAAPAPAAIAVDLQVPVLVCARSNWWPELSEASRRTCINGTQIRVHTYRSRPVWAA